MTSIYPIVPIGYGFFCFTIHPYSLQLRQWNAEASACPFDLDEHLCHTIIFVNHPNYLYGFTNSKWGDISFAHTFSVKGKLHLFFQIIIPPQGLFFRPIRINDHFI